MIHNPPIYRNTHSAIKRNLTDSHRARVSLIHISAMKIDVTYQYTPSRNLAPQYNISPTGNHEILSPA